MTLDLYPFKIAHILRVIGVQVNSNDLLTLCHM